MSKTRYWVQLATEQFAPGDLVRQAFGERRHRRLRLASPAYERARS
jgi:hypothetical protein